VLGLGSFTFFGLTGKDELASCSPDCTEDRIDAVKSRYLVADVSLLVAVISGVAATVFVLAAPSSAGRVP
jgi:hypothetical protein